MKMNDMLVICREVCKNSGQIVVYPINAPVTGDLLARLSIRGRVNPELRYFVVSASDWAKEERKSKIEKLLLRKGVTPRAIDAMGGIVEV